MSDPAPPIDPTRRVRCSVPAEEAGARLDRFLAGRGFLPTRSRVASLIRGGLVTVDGTVRKASFAVPEGALVEITIPPEPPSTVEPEDIPLRILHEDDWLIAIDKPPGMASHPAPGAWTGTVVAALLHRWSLEGDWPDPKRPGIVHRLDRDTTGVMVIAKTPESMHCLARQFARRTVTKTYAAVVTGVPRAAEGRIDLPIGRDPVDRKRMQAREGQRREARTRYSIVKVLGGEARVASLLQLVPETGRTHQIRVHLASIGHPIVGDPLYGSSRARRGTPTAERSAIESFPRQALHAERLEVRHPRDGEPITFEAPLPDDVRALLRELGA